MKLLAVDTATSYLCLGISDGSLAYECTLDCRTRLSGMLAASIQRALAALGWKVSDLDRFACGIGPGSFTALRIGMAAVKALAWVAAKPVVGVSSLDILARNALTQETDYVVPVIDAKRKLVYTAVYRKLPGRLVRVSAYALLDRRQLVEFLCGSKRVVHPRTAVMLGDGIPVVAESVQALGSHMRLLDKDHWQPCAGHVLACAREAIDHGDCTDAFRVKPLYLYPKECQIRR